MQTAVEVHMAQKYRVSDKNDKEVFDHLNNQVTFSIGASFNLD